MPTRLIIIIQSGEDKVADGVARERDEAVLGDEAPLGVVGDVAGGALVVDRLANEGIVVEGVDVSVSNSHDSAVLLGSRAGKRKSLGPCLGGNHRVADRHSEPAAGQVVQQVDTAVAVGRVNDIDVMIHNMLTRANLGRLKRAQPNVEVLVTQP